jgi:hypothetical protein
MICYLELAMNFKMNNSKLDISRLFISTLLKLIDIYTIILINGLTLTYILSEIIVILIDQ